MIRFPAAKKKKFYLTTAIAYTNGPPHMGHAYQFIVSDVIARWHRLKGEDVFFLTGTDEYGTKLKKTAEKLGIPPQNLTDENTEKFKKIDRLLKISFDNFIRTTDKKVHWPTAQKVWQILVKNGDIYKKKYSGLYCYGCEGFKTKRELVNGLCPEHQKAPETFEEENYFFRLTNYTKKLAKLIEKDEILVLPEARKHETLNILKGIDDISFSRATSALDWGIPVPGDDSQVIYVWCDALTNYLSGIGFTSNPKQFKKYWPADLHILGKDNLKFHTIFWPAMLLSAKLPLPKRIFVHGFVTSGGQKMSKSIGNVIDPFEIIKSYGSDQLRYFLVKEIIFGEDGDFSEQSLINKINGELAADLGNLVYRVLSLAEKYNGKIEGKKYLEKKFDMEKIGKLFDELKIHEALEEIWSSVRATNKYINENEPWKLKGKELGNVIYNLLESIRVISILVSPVLPYTSKKIDEQIGVKAGILKDCKFKKFSGKVKKGEILFKKIE